MALTDSADAGLTNYYATKFGTKLDNGFALAGGYTNIRAGLLSRPTRKIAFSIPRPSLFHDHARPPDRVG